MPMQFRGRKLLSHPKLNLTVAALLLILESLRSIHGISIAQDLLVIFLGFLITNHLRSEFEKNQRSTSRLFLIARKHKFGILLNIVAFFFFTLWLSRWIFHPEFIFFRDVTATSSAYLQLGAGLIFINEIGKIGFFKSWFDSVEMTSIRRFLYTYVLLSVVATGLLILPFSLNDNINISLIDAFFISVSAITVTGLTPIDVANSFSYYGLTIILVLIQVGGLGIVALTALAAAVTSRRLSLQNMNLGVEFYGITDGGKVTQFLIKVVSCTIMVEAIGAAVIYLSLPNATPDKFFHALFHSVSAFCNAGFSSFSGNLMNELAGGIIIPILFLVVLGGIGFPVLFEVISAIKNRRSILQLTSNTYMVLTMTAFLVIGGTITLMISGFASNPADKGVWTVIWESVFYSISARTAGFNVSDLSLLGFPVHFCIIFLMFIGAAPFSTAGGVKVTTIGVLIASTLSFFSGHKWIQFYKNEIPPFALQKSVAIVFSYIMVSFLAIIGLLIFENIDPWPLIFESVSALSTVGLSIGATENLSPLGKLIMSLLMLIGRMGLATIIFIGIGQINQQKFRYSTGKFYVG
ncbi:MAG: hypothetical protein A2Z20_00255 [Bdellovibrionales bacterium RBG_16_40_8]|nr:MAG: hypothetical protein A2Z20_00255 [Bdellovibrionales bacterium RBG_16_40_8]